MHRLRHGPGTRIAAVAGGALAGVLLLVPAARADVVTLLPIKDNTLIEDPNGSLSNGAGTGMFVGRTQQATGAIRRAVLSFDIAGNIPALSTINSVSLTLNLSMGAGDTQTIQLRRLTADWGEGTSVGLGAGGGAGGPSTTNDATWIHRFFNTSTWTTPGGDFSSTVSASRVVGPNFGAYTWTSDQLRADVQAMLDSPATNFGWILIGNEAAPGSAMRFDTREHPTASVRPMLIVDFTPIPEPGSFALAGIALGIFGWLARRQRRMT